MDKYLYGVIALLLAGILGVGVYAAVRNPSEAVSLPSKAVEAVSEAAEEVAEGVREEDDDSSTVTLPAESQTTPSGSAASFTMAEVKKHNSASSCYTVVNGSVYDLTQWIDRHPGGQGAILQICGQDGSSLFEDQHGGQRRPENELARLKVGTLK